jgi:hypothetical protein
VAAPLYVTFAGGTTGEWRIDRVEARRGDGLLAVEYLAVLEGRNASVPAGSAWTVCGVTSNQRYVTRTEHEVLVARQPPLGRPDATRAALIPVRKTDAWWELPQDERRTVFEDQSRHIAIGLEYPVGQATGRWRPPPTTCPSSACSQVS